MVKCVIVISVALSAVYADCSAYLCSSHITVELLCIFAFPPFAAGFGVQMFGAGYSIFRHLLVQLSFAFLPF